MWIYIWVLYLTDLCIYFYVNIMMPFNTIVLSQNWRLSMLMPPAVFFLLKIALAVGVHLFFHVNLKMVFFQFWEWWCGGFHWYCIKSVNCFCWDGHFHNIYSSSLFPYSRVFLNSFKVLKCSSSPLFVRFITKFLFVCLVLCFYSSYWGGISSLISQCVFTDFMLISCLLLCVKYLSTVRVLWWSLGVLFCVTIYHRQTEIL